MTIKECGKFASRQESLEVLGCYEDKIVWAAAGWIFARRAFVSYGLHRFALL